MATLHLVGFITCVLNNCVFCPLAECLTYLGCLLFSGRACGLIIASRSASCRPFQILRCAAESTINGSYIRKHIFYLTSPDQIEPLCPPFIVLVPLALLSSFEQINAWGHDSVGFSIFTGQWKPQLAVWVNSIGEYMQRLPPRRVLSGSITLLCRLMSLQAWLEDKARGNQGNRSNGHKSKIINHGITAYCSWVQSTGCSRDLTTQKEFKEAHCSRAG